MAAPGMSSGRRFEVPGGSSLKPASTAVPAITLKTKTDRQPKASVSRPPNTSPALKLDAPTAV
jgi:hypothetical protein